MNPTVNRVPVNRITAEVGTSLHLSDLATNQELSDGLLRFRQSDEQLTIASRKHPQRIHIPTFLAIFILALLSFSLADWKQRPFQNGLWKRSHWFVLTQLLYFPVVISLGVLYPASGPSFYHAESNASRVCGLLGWLSLVTAGLWVYRMRGFRWFGFSLVMVLQVVLMGALFVAGMAVSGDWL